MVKYFDDSQWSLFPSIGKRLKNMASKEECMVVGVCADRGVWAVGVAMRSKCRQVAAEIALAASIAVNATANGEPLNLDDIPVFGRFVREAHRLRELKL
mmetsp:Transcript_31199/g.83015  ORF Transcript_31199/g.83015 Transcript_31199/m.83015 type:complete len:99 (-) Transcript_31199:95-391(-)